MISILWVFIGCVVGLLIVAVFSPPIRNENNVPIPHKKNLFYTKSGCVKFRTEEVPCTADATSLNLFSSQSK